MSPLSSDIRIALTPAMVAAATPRLYREAEVAQGGEPLDALGELLRELRLKGRARVVLSHELAGVWLLPPAPVRLKPAEMQGWVRDRLLRQFGEAAGGWRVVWQPVPPGEAVLAGAVEAGWLAALQQTLLDNGLKPAAVEPWLVAACGRLRSALGKGASWLALAEPGRITLARIERGEFRTLRSGRVAGDPAAGLGEMVARESLLADAADGSPVWLQSVGVQADWRGAAGLDVRLAAGAQSGLAAMM